MVKQICIILMLIGLVIGIAYITRNDYIEQVIEWHNEMRMEMIRKNNTKKVQDAFDNIMDEKIDIDDLGERVNDATSKVFTDISNIGNSDS